MNPTGRFSNRVEYYKRCRPGYPDAALDVLQDILKPDSAVADIGSGTGISSRWLMQRVRHVIGVEPNQSMREAATGVESVHGTAEQTGLADASVDVVVCATAFHWFDLERTRVEFRRILKPGGHVVLLWNIRKREASRFQEEYERLIADFGADYSPQWDHGSGAAVEEFFEGKYESAMVGNEQTFDWEGLCGRVYSASYMPLPGDTGHEAMLSRLRSLFDEFQQNGSVRFEYDTKIYWSQLSFPDRRQ